MKIQLVDRTYFSFRYGTASHVMRHESKTTLTVMNAVNFITWISSLWSQFVNGQNVQCSYRRNFQGNSQDSFQWSYKGLSSYTWCFSTDPNFVLTLNCREVKMTKFTGYCRDTLNVTTTGRLRDSNVFCDPFQVKGSSIIMKLFSVDGSGNFKCNIKSEPANECYCGYRGANFRLKITGGKPAGVHEFTSLAGLVDSQSRQIVCGATLINERLALTAAHCVIDSEMNVKDARNFGLLVGAYDYTSMNNSSTTYLYRIRKFLPNTNFKFEIRDDIALIETTIAMWFDWNVGPACLPYKFPSRLYQEQLTIAGWGHTEFGGSNSNVLLKGTVTIQYPSTCVQIDAYRATYSSETMVCTSGNGVDSCQGDSGGPAYYTDPSTGLLFIFGVIATGVGCGNYPSISVRVFSYLGWIHDNYQDVSYCAIP